MVITTRSSIRVKPFLADDFEFFISLNYFNGLMI